MVYINKKLIDIKTGKCIGGICSNSDNKNNVSVALSIAKLKELNIQDSDILEYLDVDSEEVVSHPRRKGYYALCSKATMIMEDFIDTPYDSIGSYSDIFSLSEVIWGYLFRYTDFVQLDNLILIKQVIY